MKIIVEGCDGSGKTTLAKTLASVYGLSYTHYGPELNTYEILMECAAILDDAVIDRFHYSQMVYGPICRGEPALSLKQVHDIEMMLGVRSTFIILCDPGWNAIEKGWDSQFLSVAQLGVVHHEYFLFKRKYSTYLRTITYNYQSENPIDIIRKLEA